MTSPSHEDATLSRSRIVLVLILGTISILVLLYFAARGLRPRSRPSAAQAGFWRAFSTKAPSLAPRTEPLEYLLDGRLRFEMPRPPLASTARLRIEEFPSKQGLLPRSHAVVIKVSVGKGGRFKGRLGFIRSHRKEMMQHLVERGPARARLFINSADGTQSYVGDRDVHFVPGATRIDFGNLLVREQEALVGGRLTDAQGRPLDSHHITAYFADTRGEEPSLRPVSAVGRAITDAAGRFCVLDSWGLSFAESKRQFLLVVERKGRPSPLPNIRYLRFRRYPWFDCFTVQGGDLDLHLKGRPLRDLKIRFAAVPGLSARRLVAHVQSAGVGDGFPPEGVTFPLKEKRGWLEADASLPEGPYTVGLELRNGTLLSARYALVGESGRHDLSDDRPMDHARPLVVVEIQDAIGRSKPQGKVIGEGLELLSERNARQYFRTSSDVTTAVVTAPDASPKSVELKPGLNVVQLPSRESHRIELDIEGLPEFDNVTYWASVSLAQAASTAEPPHQIRPGDTLRLSSELVGYLAIRFKARCVIKGVTQIHSLSLPPLFFEANPENGSVLSKRLTPEEQERVRGEVQGVKDD